MRFDRRVYGPGVLKHRGSRVLLARPGREYTEAEARAIMERASASRPVDVDSFELLAPDEVTFGPVVEPVHVGGGMYELPDGRRFKGRDAALAALDES